MNFMELFYRTYPLSEIQEILFDANEFIRANKKRSSKGNDGKSTSQTDSDSEKRGNEKNKQQRLKLYPGSKKDYETLGLANGSKLEEVKKEYRKLARQYHPDLNPGNEKAEEQFKQVTEAKDRLEDALESDSAMSAADAPGGIDLSLTTIRFEGTSEIKMLNPPVSLDTATMIGFMFQIQNTQPITNLQNYLMPL